uniref:Kelch-like protein 12 n=1 Tax=Phallusia mammillata TaxID=59560 RepID=A0A6F9DF81_9ASCI|nr:kelch-like protein 12 [Phallusia mammillata]
MNEITYGLASVELHGKIYAIGGWGKQAVECYDPVAGKWRLLAQKQIDSSHHGDCVVNEQIYAVGGWNGCKSLNSVEVYDKLQDSWSPCFTLVKPVYGHTVVAI